MFSEIWTSFFRRIGGIRSLLVGSVRLDGNENEHKEVCLQLRACAKEITGVGRQAYFLLRDQVDLLVYSIYIPMHGRPGRVLARPTFSTAVEE